MKIIFRIHAIQRMFGRGVSAEDVRAVLESGETIIVTVYEPDGLNWESNFKRRKK
jgi:hypothetical protein